MSYSMNNLASSWQYFYALVCEEHQVAYNNLRDTLSEMENMSDDEVYAATDQYLQSIPQALQNAADAVLNSESVANSPEATSAWQDFQSSSWCPFVCRAIAADYVCDREKTQQFIDDYTETNISPKAESLLNQMYTAAVEGWEGLTGIPLPSGMEDIIKGIITGSYKDKLVSIYDWFLTPEYSDLSDFDFSGFCPTLYNSAQAVQPSRVDPLTLDLDGDGIETIAVSLDNPIVFDHDGDGLKTGTGWINPDDGFLVMDRNSNGTIDNGTELFGDSTPLNIGGTAADGFAALAQEDTNFDGVVNNLDTNWNNLRIWRDLNSDAISQAGEMLTMDETGISEFNVTSIEHSRVLANGNQIADLGTYTRTDGTTATMGEVSDMADINLTIDTFNREFPDAIPVAEDVATLPDMEGSGLVRDLQEAAGRLLKTAHMLRCAATAVVATYTKSTSHFYGFARLASERF